MRNSPSHLALLDANPCGRPFRLAASRQATFPKGTASAVTGSFTAQPKGVPLGELAATNGSRLRGYFDDATATPSGEVASRNDDGEGSSLSEEVFFYICLSISSIPHFYQRCKGGKSAWNQGTVHFFYNRLIFCPYTAYICMLCAIRRGAGAISLCKDALVFGREKPVYYGYGKQQTHRKTSGAA